MATPPPQPPSNLDPGEIQFYDNYVPRLHDGSYKISVSQTLTGAADHSFSAEQKFDLNGPRWTIPASLVHSSMPPPNHCGRFEEQLPQIVLKRRTLPWERYLNKTDPDAPWMGVMLFDAGDGAQATAVLSGDAVHSVTVDQAGSGYEIAPAVQLRGGGGSGATALATIDTSGTVTGVTVTSGGSGYKQAPKVTLGSISNTSTVTLADVIAPGKDASGKPIAAPDVRLNPDFDKPTDACQIIDITTGTFAAYAPIYDQNGATDELKFCAHVRQVNTGDKEPLGMKKADGWFAVLLAKRFPRAKDNGQTANRQIAHLVSYEGYGTRMTGQASAFGTSEMVRLVSLANWTFTCLPETGESFAQLMRDLITTENNSSYLLKPYFEVPNFTTTGAVKTAQQTLNLGYLPLAYQTLQGEHTFAWYRGPLSPVVPPEFPDDPHLESPSGSVIYNPHSGVFDQSYAVAFQTGRLLALSDRSFGSSLLKWRREAHQLVNLLVERLPSSDIDALKSIDAATARQLLEQDAVSGDMMAWLVDDFARKIAPKLSQPTSPVNRPERPPVNNPGQAIQDLQTALETPEFQRMLRDLSGWDSDTKTFSNPRFQRICEWLASMVLLEGVPFKNLVPASNMLPNGSIRFFYIDPNISKTMIDGAMSVAGQTSRDTLYYAIMRDVIRDAVSVLIRQLRQKTLGVPVTLPQSRDQPITGFLLRSAAVSGWPGLEVKAFRGINNSGPIPNGEGPINLLRMQRLAADVLLVLFPEAPAWIQIAEPKEGIAFGIEDGLGGHVIASADSAAHSFIISSSHDLSSVFPSSSKVAVTKSAGNNGTYTVNSTSFDRKAYTFKIVVTETVRVPAGGGLIWEAGSNFNPIWIRHLVGTYEIASVSSLTKTFTITTSVDYSNLFSVTPPTNTVHVTGSQHSDGIYTVASTSFNQGIFSIVVNEAVPSSTGGGTISNGNIGAQFGTDPKTDAIDATKAITESTGAINMLIARQLLANNAKLKTELAQKTYAAGTLTPGDFALQMVKLPERMIFNNPSYKIASASTAGKSFTIDTGTDLSAGFPVKGVVRVTQSTANDGTYTVASVAFNGDGGTFTVVVSEPVPSSTGDGQIWQPGAKPADIGSRIKTIRAS